MKNNYKKLIFGSFLFSITGLLLLYFQIDNLPIQKIVFPWLILAFLAAFAFWIGEALDRKSVV